MEGIYLLRRDN